MKIAVKMVLGLLILAPGLYAMDGERKTQAQAEADQFEKERKTKMERSAPVLDGEGERVKDDLAAIDTCDGVAKQSEEAIADAVAQATQYPLEKACVKAASLPTNVQECIWSFADEENRKKRFVGNHMEQLIPAVIEWVDGRSIFDYLTQLKTSKITQDEINKYHEELEAVVSEMTGREIRLPRVTEWPIDKLYYVGEANWEGKRMVHPHDEMILPRQSIMNAVLTAMGRPRPTSTTISERRDSRGPAVLATERRPIQFFSTNQLNVLYYTNGSTVFKVHDEKFAELEKLSDAQLKYIIKLYHTRARTIAEDNTARIHLTQEQISIHKSLPTSMRVNLQNVYHLAEIKQERAAANRRKQSCTRLAYASLVAALGFRYLL